VSFFFSISKKAKIFCKITKAAILSIYCCWFFIGIERPILGM
jgi:hypothetical protein